MKFLADENVPRPLIRLMLERGHDVVYVKNGSSDVAIFSRSKREVLPIITNDTDFLDITAFPLAKTPGRIVLRIFPTIFSFQRDRLGVFLTEILPTLEIAERLVVLTAEEVIIRKE